jgi:pimeloyl-ACP methyl ester carboxylesterase
MLDIISSSLLISLIFIGGIFAIAYGSICVFLLLRQNHYIFFPSSIIEKTPALFNLDYEDAWIPVSPKTRQIERIHAWWIPANEPEARVLLYLHGNGFNIGANIAHATRFHQLGFSVLLVDYRGYGRSQGGFPSESQVYQDAEAAWNYLIQKRQIPGNQIFVYGHSLGGAIAIDLAVSHPEAAGLILESTFTSMQAMVALSSQFRIFPVKLLLNQQFDSITKVKLLKMPVLFIHGTADSLVPVEMSKMLFAVAAEPKQIFLVPAAGHNDVADVAGNEYLQTIEEFVEQAIA